MYIYALLHYHLFIRFPLNLTFSCITHLTPSTHTHTHTQQQKNKNKKKTSLPIRIRCKTKNLFSISEFLFPYKYKSALISNIKHALQPYLSFISTRSRPLPSPSLAIALKLEAFCALPLPQLIICPV